MDASGHPLADQNCVTESFFLPPCIVLFSSFPVISIIIFILECQWRVALKPQ